MADCSSVNKYSEVKEVEDVENEASYKHFEVELVHTNVDIDLNGFFSFYLFQHWYCIRIYIFPNFLSARRPIHMSLGQGLTKKHAMNRKIQKKFRNRILLKFIVLKIIKKPKKKKQWQRERGTIVSQDSC